MTDNNGSAQSGQPGAAGAGGTNPGAATGGEWYAGIGDEQLRGYVQTKGFKDPAALADSYRNLEKLVGVPHERIVKLPERSDDAEGWGAVHARLGRPDDPKGYELKFDGDPAFAEKFGGVFHEAGLSKAQAGKLNEAWNGYVADMIAEDTRQREQKDAADMANLRTKWGQTFDQNAELGRRAGREFGLSEDQFKAISGALGSGATLELFQRIGSKLAEPAAFNAEGGAGGGSGFGLTPEAAKARISSLRNDQAWTADYLKGDVAKREEMDRLHRIAAGLA